MCIGSRGHQGRQALKKAPPFQQHGHMVSPWDGDIFQGMGHDYQRGNNKEPWHGIVIWPFSPHFSPEFSHEGRDHHQKGEKDGARIWIPNVGLSGLHYWRH